MLTSQVALWFSIVSGVVSTTTYIVPGAIWYDTDGNKIDAHGGAITDRDGTFYWVGQAAESLVYHSKNIYKAIETTLISFLLQTRPQQCTPLQTS